LKNFEIKVEITSSSASFSTFILTSSLITFSVFILTTFSSTSFSIFILTSFSSAFGFFFFFFFFFFLLYLIVPLCPKGTKHYNESQTSYTNIIDKEIYQMYLPLGKKKIPLSTPLLIANRIRWFVVLLLGSLYVVKMYSLISLRLL